jgi:glutathionylspermidine synthase
MLSREGANITISKDGQVTETSGDYGEEGYIFQAIAPIPDFGGFFPVIGSWMIDQEAHGMGIRESRNIITDNRSLFVPHIIM